MRDTTRRGVSLVEVLVCIALLGAVLIPVGLLVLRSRGAAVASRLALLAAHAAREEVEDVRVLAHARRGSPVELSHGWQPCPPRTLDRLGDLAKTASGADLPATYPPEYRRIHTRLTVQAGPDPRIFPVLLEVRWQEQGEDAERAAERGRLAKFEFLVTRSRGASR